jgi:CMP-N,N'-diacetyllegionaminic acid synthase
MTGNVTAVVPVRAGSERVPNKNVRPFAGTTLLERKIGQLQRCRMVGGVVVSSEDDGMLEIARRAGAHVHYRDDYYSRPDVPMGEVAAHICADLYEFGHIVLWANCTSPMVGSELYDDAVGTFLALGDEYDSLVSVRRLYEHIWDEKGPVNYGLGAAHRNTQDVDPLWVVTYGFLIMAREEIVRREYYIGDRPYRYEVDKIAAVDVDDEEDFLLAEYLVGRFG